MDQIRFVILGNRLRGHETPEELELEDDDVIDMHVFQVGMISTFTASDKSDPLVKYLMLSDRERASAVKPMAELHAKAKNYRATGSFEPISDAAFFSRELFQLLLPNTEPQAVTEPVLDDRVRELLGLFLDFMWSEVAPVRRQEENWRERVDMRMSMPDELFLQLLGEREHESSPQVILLEEISPSSTAKDVLNKIHELWHWPECPQHPGGKSKIALRITKGPSNACINFHCDGSYASNTVQIALNGTTDYEGGRLCFFQCPDAKYPEGNLIILDERPAGSVCRHRRDVLHAVTALTSGTRKSLFVVDSSNGLGEYGVVHVKESDVQSFLRHNQIQRSLALCMLTHERLGHDSIWAGLCRLDLGILQVLLT
jgi:hypothetical protein